MFWDIVREWEDCIANSIGIDVYPMYNELFAYKITSYRFCRRLLRSFPFLKNLLLPKGYHVVFEMLPFLPERPINHEDYSFRYNSSNVIPWIIDCEFNSKEIELFNDEYKKFPLVLISSRKTYDILIQSGLCTDIRLSHLALSISDKYKISPNTKFEKIYDICLFGREDEVLMSFFHLYHQSHPELSVVTREIVNEKSVYVLDGETVLCDSDDRESYMSILSKCRIALYSTSHRYLHYRLTEDFVTPKFLEYVVSGVHIIARYPLNSDVDYFGLPQICPSVDSYSDFEKEFKKGMSNDINMKLYSDFIERHYTSSRAKQLKSLFSKI